MKTFAHFDSTGTIRALITVNAPKGVSAMLTPKPGLFVAEVEGLKVKSGAPDLEALREIAKAHKVATPLACYPLAKKS